MQNSSDIIRSWKEMELLLPSNYVFNLPFKAESEQLPDNDKEKYKEAD